MASTTTTTPAAPTVSAVVTAHGTRLYRNLAGIEADIAIIKAHIEPALITGLDAADSLDQKAVDLLQATVPKLQQLHSALQLLANKAAAASTSSTSTTPASAPQ